MDGAVDGVRMESHKLELCVLKINKLYSSNSTSFTLCIGVRALFKE